MSCAPLVIKPQASQLPLVPIPRLKPQQLVLASKANKKPKSKKNEGKTKKVVNISFLGSLFLILLLGGLVPIVDVSHRGIGDTINISDPHKGKVFLVGGHVNGTNHGGSVGFSVGKFFHGNRYCKGIHYRRLKSDKEQKEYMLQFKPGSDGFAPADNASEPLIASLFVPRIEKLVNIDGNLIIHSVLATKKARASSAVKVKRDGEETSLALVRSSGLPRPIPRVRRNYIRHSHPDKDASRQQRALSSGSANDFKPSTSSKFDGKLQEWFCEGLAGPTLSSSMCTEDLQFEVSLTHRSIVLAAAATNDTAPKGQKPPQLKTGRNRRILHGHPIPLGVASSIGLGSSLHTFVLYLGPHIAQFTIKALLCGQIDLKIAPYDTIQLK